ncbi:sterol O-acyltransferase 2-like [Microcaecilia unicolor]|uniref:O-acyltransferase n=1 Tax=Microcaecilia unicolor TaxID=1415580 RepID=A0A6P7XTR4_9AMPH|nr:sterol O-acyltransferase 2-like [Microcaecilia unicolor]
MNKIEESSEVRQRKKDNKEHSHIPNGDSEPLHAIPNLDYWKRQMKVVKSELLNHMHRQLNDALDRVMEEGMQAYAQNLKGHGTAESEKQKQNQQHATSGDKVKVFVERQSILDELMEVQHFRTIYHIFIAIFCVFIIATVAVDIFDEGRHRVVLAFELLFYSLGKFQIMLGVWLCMFSYSLLVPFKALHLWGSCYHPSHFPRLLSATMAVLLITCQICVLGLYPAYVVIWHKLPPASSLIVTLEQFRFMLKIHSFLRETIPQIIRTNLNKEKEVKLPTFSSYLYFLFCPTLIYRESYPRTPFIRWKYVIKNFAQFLGCQFYISFVLVTLCIPVFTNMSKQPFSTKTLVLSIFHVILPGMFILLLTFFAVLHCWPNAFAEMLRFGDRMFYKDWWNSTSFANYYRTWNIAVYEWLHYYVYRDLFRLLNKRFRTVAMLTAFLSSAVVHEYAITLSLGFFYPVMFCLFAILGVILNFIMNDKRTSPFWNIIFWTCLFIGQGIQTCLYSQEWYAQIHCPLQEKTFWALVTPRSWSCYLQQ